ncbi:hypothetical protein [Propionivibrio sp.]|uniref:hypothetical protein n=1 Tax=Propionivibrio sp. TaxID=2212460 RepID=UPI003BEF9B22
MINFRQKIRLTLAIGLGLLLVGADYYDAPDWDYPISFIMAILTYLTRDETQALALMPG